MSEQKKMVPGYRKGRHSLNHLVDFGPEKNEPVSTYKSNSGLERIKQIVKQLQEINKRIDDLASRL